MQSCRRCASRARAGAPCTHAAPRAQRLTLWPLLLILLDPAGRLLRVAPAPCVAPWGWGLQFKKIKEPNMAWIMKPVGRAQGKGIFLFTKLSEIIEWKKDTRYQPTKEGEEKREMYVVQRYIPNPLLISRRKFDMRIYVLVSALANAGVPARPPARPRPHPFCLATLSHGIARHVSCSRGLVFRAPLQGHVVQAAACVAVPRRLCAFLRLDLLDG